MLPKYSIFTRKDSKVILNQDFLYFLGSGLKTMKKNSNWKVNLDRWLFSFHQEVIKAGVIGKKLLTASRTNAHLKETYEELGRLLEKGIESGEVEWDSAKIRALLHTARACKKDLEHLEKQVYKIKFSAGPKGPEDISKKLPDYSSDNDDKENKDKS